MLPKVLDFLFVLFLMGAVPALSFFTGREIRLRPMPRLALYLSAVISQWLLAALGAGVVLATSRSFATLGFRSVAAGPFFRWASVLSGVALASMALVLYFEQRGWWPKESDLVYLLLPATGREILWSVLILAPTAAVCEEFLYRGYLVVQLSVWFRSQNWAWVTSSVAFGFAHLYQGLNGAARAALLGALLAYPVVRLGTLYPSMAAHFLIDALALAWLGPAFLRRTRPL